MYEPLQFLEQIDNYLMMPGAPAELMKAVNDKMHDFIAGLGKDFIIPAYFCVQSVLSEYVNRSTGEKAICTRYKSVFERWENELGIEHPEPEDFFDLLSFSQIRNEWGENKIVYKVDSELLKTLTNMSAPETIAIDYVTKQPVGCYYIDFNGNCPFCADSFGCFIVTHVIEGVAAYLYIVTLVNDKKSGRVMPVKTNFMLPLDEKGVKDLTKFKLGDKGNSNLSVTVESGEHYVLNEQLLLQFFVNFSIYLHAANREVEESEVTKRTYRQRPKSATPKNSFKEVRQYEVGFRYGNTIRANRKSYKKEINAGHRKESLTTRSVTSHYRSAHWHSYWVGSGDNKKLIVKWVEGVFVKGNKESSDVVVHEVKSPHKGANDVQNGVSEVIKKMDMF